MTRTAPHAHAKAARRVLSPDDEWSAAIRERIELDCHPWQLAAVQDPARRISLRVGRGGAKGLPVDEPVMTIMGERPIGSLKVGSRICAHDGTVTHVIGVYPQGERETYEIEFDDGATARCDDQHIWPIHIQGRDRDKVRGCSKSPIEGPHYLLMTMPEVLRRWDCGHRIHIPTLDAPVQFVRHAKLKPPPVDPYLLGVLLGDCSLRDGDFRFCTTDHELAVTVLDAGFREHAPDKRNGLRNFGLARASSLYRRIGGLGLTGKRAWEKSIPDRYRTEVADVRLSLLQGLMDTDGTADKRGHALFCSTSKQLALDVQWLARSLGAKATLWDQKTPRRDAYKVYIQTGGKFNAFRLKRKADRCPGYQHAKLWRRVVAIRPYGKRQTVCIKVDHPMGLFITRDFVVTHNTTTMRARALIKIVTLREQRLGYAATSADQARDLNWDKIKSSCEAYDIRSTPGAAWSSGSGKRSKPEPPDVTFLDTKMIMTCHRTGSVLRLRGVEDKRDAEKFRGFPQAEFDVDEAGSFPPELLEYLIDQCVAPRLGEALALDGGRGGCLVLGSTPPTQLRGMFYEVTRHGSARHRPYVQRELPEFAAWKGFSSHAWTLKDVYDLPEARDRYPALVANWEEALIEKAEKGWSDDNPIWMREYLGEWSADNTAMVFRYRPHVDGAEWNQWNPHGEQFIEGIEGLRKAIAALPKDEKGKPMQWFYVYAGDTGGTRDPYALNIFAFSPTDSQRRIFNVFSFERMNVYARPIAQMMLGADEASPTGCHSPDSPRGLIGLTGWPIGMVIDSDQNMIDELANVYGLRFAKAGRQADYKFGAVELCNGDLVEGMIKVMKGSPLEKQVATLQWKPDDFGNQREDKAQANHCTDCLLAGRRLIAHLFESGSVTQDSAKRPEMYKDPQGLGEEDGAVADDWDDKLLSSSDWSDTDE